MAVVTSLPLVSGVGLADDTGSAARYRGGYTWGHEVNTFCPDTNAQCYWLSPDTPADVRSVLRELSQSSSPEPYTPVCVLVEARIDRESPRQGFAADYDGLITVSRFLGTCDSVSMVIASDLQHHRWVLETLNDAVLPAPESGGTTPELDFGERMTITGNTGCNKFSGNAVLLDGLFLIEAMALTRRLCPPPWNDIERSVLRVLGQESRIAIDADRRLVLESANGELVFRLQDWVAAGRQ